MEIPNFSQGSTALPYNPRSSLGNASTGGGGSRFPDGLPLEEYVILKVYNTPVADLMGKAIQQFGQNIPGTIDKMVQNFGNNKYMEAAVAGGTAGTALGLIGGSGLGAIGGGIAGAITGAGITAGYDIVSGLSKGMADPLMKDIGKFFSQAKATIGSGSFTNAELSRNFITSYYLPIPVNISETLAHQYQAEEGWLTSMPGGGAIKSAMTTIAGLNAVYSKMTGARSQIFNENKISMYKGTNLRSFSLEWTLVPNNAQESQTIQKMIMDLKKYSSAEESKGGLLLEAPNFFMIEFGNEYLQNNLQFYEVNIENIAVSYVPGGSMEMFYDKSPKNVQLSITFKEREPKLRHHWDSKKGSKSGGFPTAGMMGNTSSQKSCPSSSGTSSGSGGSSGRTIGSNEDTTGISADSWRDGSNDVNDGLIGDYNFDEPPTYTKSVQDFNYA